WRQRGAALAREGVRRGDGECTEGERDPDNQALTETSHGTKGKSSSGPAYRRPVGQLVMLREPQVRIELTTARLRIGCSTPELLWRVLRNSHPLAAWR